MAAFECFMAGNLTTMEEGNFSFQAKSQSPDLTNPGRSTLNRDQTNRPFNPE
jgi:hypothetical protein